MIRDVFEKRFGRVAEIFLATTNKFGFVTFESGSSAQAALAAKGIDIEGKHVVIKDADPERSGGRRGRSRSRSRSRSPPRGYGALPGYPGYPGYYGGYPGYPPPGYGYPPAYGAPP